MFEARLWIKRQDKPDIYLNKDDILKAIPDAVDCEVLVESGGEDRTKGSSKMTLRCWNKENGYHARYIPLTSTPISK